MILDYQAIIDVIGEIMQYCLPVAITIGLCERLISWIVRCATGKES